MSPDDFRRLADLNAEPALLLSRQGRVLAANRHMRQLGLAPERLPGRHLSEIAAAPGLNDYLRMCARTANPVVGAAEVHGDDGRVSKCRCYGAVLHFDPEGQHTQIVLRFASREGPENRFLALNQKLAELNAEVRLRRLVERRLREQTDWLQVTLSSIGDAVITTDAAGSVTFLNPVAETLTGWPGGEAVGRPLDEVFRIIDETSREAIESPVSKVLRHGTVVELANHTLLVARDGTERPIDDTAAPIRDANGNLIGVVLVFRDVSERRQSQQTLRQRAEELTEADRRKNEFLAMLAHELRNPLAPIRSGLDLLAVEHGESEAIQLMQEQVAHVVRLVDDLLDVSRIVTGRIELRRETVPLRTIITRAVEAVRPLMTERDHHLHVALPSEPVYLYADPVRMTQVLTNLLHNAAKYTDPGGEIQLTARCSRDGVTIAVKDNGIGIAPALLPHVFELFIQSERTIDRSQGGLGLGLTLVRNLVELHDGTVAAYSRGPGCGSEFVVNLPIHAATSQTPAQRPGVSQLPSRRFLVVDDNVGAAKMLRLLLLHYGAEEVDLAHDGPEALQAAAAHRPEIILLDIGLPRMDGYEVARRLRGELGLTDALLVAVTGYGQAEDISRSMAAGFDEHLVKPPSLEALLALFTHPKLAGQPAVK